MKSARADNAPYATMTFAPIAPPPLGGLHTQLETFKVDFQRLCAVSEKKDVLLPGTFNLVKGHRRKPSLICSCLPTRERDSLILLGHGDITYSPFPFTVRPDLDQ